MLYYKNLESLIFSRHELIQCDELVVISGYVGPDPIKRISKLPLQTTVVYGMYASDGIHLSLYNKLLTEVNKISNLRVLFSTVPIHSKAYMWLNKGKVVYSLVGSANFSSNGLQTPFKETLAEATTDTFSDLEEYRDYVFKYSIPCTEARVKQSEKKTTIVEPDSKACEIPLFKFQGGKKVVLEKSWLNWGFADANVNIDDAYIGIPVDCLRKHPNMFPPKRTVPPDEAIIARKGHRHNETVEVIFDDGVSLTMLLEGNAKYIDASGNIVLYPKQFASTPRKSKLGQYLRKRMGVASGTPIVYDDLLRYGRDSIEITLLGEGLYYFNFKPREDKL